MRNVIIIDDDIFLTHALRRVLDQNQFCTTVYNTVPPASVSLGNFDLAIIDIHLPLTSGLDLVKELRLRSNLPILFISGSIVPGIVCDALRVGGDDFLRKPFDTQELVERARALLRRAAPLSSRNQSTLDDLEGFTFLHAERKLLGPSGAVIALTEREVGILYLLWHRGGESITRDEISRHVMRRNYDPSDRSIDVHVSNLRAKLRAYDCPLGILVDRNIGYRLVRASKSQTARP